MGCASSKLFRKDFSKDFVFGNGNCSNHVVSLTSTTYGFLKLDQNQPIREISVDSKKLSSPLREEYETIDTFELMKGLEEDDDEPFSIRSKKSPKTPVFNDRSPFKVFNAMGSTKKTKNFEGKENMGFSHRHNVTPKTPLKESNFGEIVWDRSPMEYRSVVKSECSRTNSVFSTRRNLSPLFDPELVAFYEKELSEEEEQIKKMIFETPNSKNTMNSISALDSFERKCPPGGEHSVVIYTTTLRGIRKTFEQCNTVRSIIESHDILFIERDISMDSGYKEELRELIGAKEAKVPVLFVKGRLIGGVDEVVKLEDKGKLVNLFAGMPRGVAIVCDGCAGIRFVMCMDCCGSCKVFDENGENKVRCVECNENGLIQCPICC